jgi:hypothetical protein
VAAHTARAQTPSRAETLFNEGLEAMRAARYEQACPALQESYRLDPMPGVLFTAAECEGAWGKVATALAHYDEFLRVLTTLPPAQQKKHLERRQLTLQKMTALSRLAPQLTVVLPSGAPAGVVVKRNGVVLDALAFGVASPVDPGTYSVTFEAPGKPVQERRFALAKGQQATVGADVVWAPEAAGPGNPQGPGAVQPPVQGDSPPNRTAAWVVGGVGLAGLAVGAVTGALTWSKKSTIEAECPERQCTPEGRSAVDSAQTTGLLSSLGFGVGVLGVAAASVMLLTSKPAQSGVVQARGWEPVLSPHPGGGFAGMRGRF